MGGFNSSSFVTGALALSSLALAACGGDECRTDAYPPAPDGAAGLVHVAAGCPAEDADGSPERPYPTIQQGIDRAQSGGAVLIAPGSYAENLSVAKPVQVIGASPDAAPADAPVVLSAPTPYAITVAEGTQGVLLRGLAVESPIAVGIWVQQSAQATVDGARIEGARPDSSGQYGYGVLATGDSAIIFCRSAITGAALAGVLVSGARGEIDTSTIRDNRGRGGIRVEMATAEVSIHDNELDGNTEVAIGAYSSPVRIERNTLSNTQASGAENIGDGLVVSRLKDDTGAFLGEADAIIEGNTIEGNARIGVLFSADARGSILNNQISGNGVPGVFSAGIWAQQGAGGQDGLLIQGNAITGNRYVGIGLKSAARAIIDQNTAIDDTVMDQFIDDIGSSDMGDGIGVFDGAYAEITGNMIRNSGRCGVLLDSPDETSTIAGNTISGSAEFGVVFQNLTMSLDLTSNTFSGNMSGDSKTATPGEYDIKTADVATP